MVRVLKQVPCLGSSLVIRVDVVAERLAATMDHHPKLDMHCGDYADINSWQ